MKIHNEQIDGMPVLTLSGRFDAYTAPAVEQAFRTMLTASLSSMIVDLTQVDFIDSIGLATLVIGMKLCRQHGGELAICGMRTPIKTIFELTHLDRVFILPPTRDDAFAAICSRSGA